MMKAAVHSTGQLSPDRPIVVLTGAGISVESGLPTFRGKDGLWEGWRLEDVATPGAFARDPVTVQRFFNERRRQLLQQSVSPNPAHEALARLEARWPGGVLIVTQNIDDLHERAGSRDVVHMHGELLKARCVACGSVQVQAEDIDPHESCTSCATMGQMRPHVVWFGEMPMELDRIYAALEACGLFVSIGTSGNVYPAAGFVDIVRHHADAHTIEINLEPTALGSRFAEHRHGRAGDIVPELVSELLDQAT